ncbi:MAG: hypothetical protein ACFFAO_12495 [Candidatus Hermodarchaeota archaeon]
MSYENWLDLKDSQDLEKQIMDLKKQRDYLLVFLDTIVNQCRIQTLGMMSSPESSYEREIVNFTLLFNVVNFTFTFNEKLGKILGREDYSEENTKDFREDWEKIREESMKPVFKESCEKIKEKFGKVNKEKNPNYIS